MEYSEERDFVKRFIRKNKRERLLYELSKPEKRYEGISRFCHQAADFLDPSKIRLSGSDLTEQAEFKDFVAKHDETCCILSPESFLEEIYLPLKEAVEQAAMSTDAMVILGKDFALIFTEAGKGGREKYLLWE